MKNMIRLLWVLVVIAGIYACAQIEVPVKVEPIKDAYVSTSIYRGDGNLNIDILIPEASWDYTSVLSDDGHYYTIVVKDIKRKLGDVNMIRPILSVKRTDYPSGFKLVFNLANRQKLETFKNELGLHIVLTALEPDMEMLAMKTFGAWSDPVHPARKFKGIDHQKMQSIISFDAPPLYATGEAGGRHYLDIFGVDILSGIIKHKGILATNKLDGKTRLIFKNKVQVCPDEFDLILGKSCTGYVGLSGFTREKNAKTESFLFMLPGRPEMKVMQIEGMTAFGFKDTRLFSQVFQQYIDGNVYKVEAREKDGMLWLIFLYNGDLKYRKYYSGDKFFVVFYRG
ncbi:MAG: hypothetical protein C0603_13310 [Denitrovibrio sp.]|nr:MAG: hypothetical protein C0603_13310 [Denitrovibrio sp.]